MSVSCEYCVLSGTGLCDKLNTRPEDSYRQWCVDVCDLEKVTLVNEDEGQHALRFYHAKRERNKTANIAKDNKLLRAFPTSKAV